MEYRVGFCQFKPELLNVDANLEKLKVMLKGVEADLIVLPELAFSGYIFKSKEEVLTIAEEPGTSKSIDLFRKLAAENNTSYIAGFAELDGEKVYNSCFLVNPDGTLYVYRKTHLFSREKLFFDRGDSGFFVVEAKSGVKIGMMVCFDWIFPESARTLALKGAQIICHPSNLVLPWCQQAMITRSIENRVFTITANRTGREKNGEFEMYFTGQSQVTTPKGEVLNRLNETEETVWITNIDPELANNKMVTEFNHVHNDRRSEFYL
jgi:predicted amidohydrolase